METTFKKYISTFCLLLLTSIVSAQTKSDFDIKISVGCGYAGQTDKEFVQYKNYIYNKDYQTIRNNLNSLRLYDQLLSVISLDELSLQGKVILTDVEKETISKFKLSTKKYYMCSGCTGHDYEKIKNIFKKGDPDGHLKIIKHHLGFKVDF